MFTVCFLFCFLFDFLSTISRQPAGRFTPKFPTCPLPLWGLSAPGEGGGVKNSKNGGVVSFVLRTATIFIFLTVAKFGSLCRAQTCAQSGLEPSRSAKVFLQGGPKTLKKIRIFHHFEILRPYISETNKNRAIYAAYGNNFISPLSNCRMCMDPSLTGFYRVSQKVSDVIQVLRLTPIATQPSAISVFLSVAKCGRVRRSQNCAHSGIEPSTLAKGFLQGGRKVRKNFEFLTISSLYVPYISATTKIEAY